MDEQTYGTFRFELLTCTDSCTTKSNNYCFSSSNSIKKTMASLGVDAADPQRGHDMKSALGAQLKFGYIQLRFSLPKESIIFIPVLKLKNPN